MGAHLPNRRQLPVAASKLVAAADWRSTERRAGSGVARRARRCRLRRRGIGWTTARRRATAASQRCHEIRRHPEMDLPCVPDEVQFCACPPAPRPSMLRRTGYVAHSGAGEAATSPGRRNAAAGTFAVDMDRRRRPQPRWPASARPRQSARQSRRSPGWICEGFLDRLARDAGYHNGLADLLPNIRWLSAKRF